jgi:hypothetical protein
MNISKEKQEKISLLIIKVLISRFKSFPNDLTNSRNSPFHNAFINAFSDKINTKINDIPFLINLSSWLHGLNTTLGQTFFENLAHILFKGEKREFTSGRGTSLKISQEQINEINSIISDLDENSNPNLEEENRRIFIKGKKLIYSENFSCDVFQIINGKITAIELKTVKPNSGLMKSEKRKILTGKASLYNEYPNHSIEFFIGFPFDPTENPKTPTKFNLERFKKSVVGIEKYIDDSEILIASQLWDKLSGYTNTMEDILEIINAIANPDFLGNLNYLNNPNNIGNEKYKSLCQKWYFHNELSIINNLEYLKTNMKENNEIEIYLGQQLFKDNFTLNSERRDTLMKFLF